VMGRGRRGRRRGAGSVHMWTVWKLTESQGFVNFRSLDIRGDVHRQIRVVRTSGRVVVAIASFATRSAVKMSPLHLSITSRFDDDFLTRHGS
jgi:hypothetical protein